MIEIYNEEEDDDVDEVRLYAGSQVKFIPIGKWSVNVVKPVKNLNS